MAKIAYFSMEVALDSALPNFAGGLGVLAADLLMSAADLSAPLVGVSLMYHQSDSNPLDVSPWFKRRDEVVYVGIEGRGIKVRCYEYILKGETGHQVPIYFLSTLDPENERWDRDITKKLYAGDRYTRLCQEVILGVGGVRMLRALGYGDLRTFHMNEGHSALLTLERLKEEAYSDEAVRQTCTFTTHTPVPAGHDQFDYELANRVLGQKMPWHIKKLAGDDALHMTRLALNLSRKANGVSDRHREVCETMFPKHTFTGITNGVHAHRWVSDTMAALFNKHLPGWQQNPTLLKGAKNLPPGELDRAHKANEKALVDEINAHPEWFSFDKIEEADRFDTDGITVAYARRMVPYKRPLLIFSDLDRLREIGYHKLQLVFAGKPYESDAFSADVIAKLRHYGQELRGQIRVAFIPDYNLDIAKKLVSGADIWLNTPEPPMEASGTSGMKAALNGTLNLSILDGWWIEGYHLEPRAGWAFGEDSIEKSPINRNEIDAQELYTALADAVRCYTEHGDHWHDRMRAAVRLGATFNTHRCLQDYLETLWK